MTGRIVSSSISFAIRAELRAVGAHEEERIIDTCAIRLVPGAPAQKPHGKPKQDIQALCACEGGTGRAGEGDQLAGRRAHSRPVD